MQNEEAVVNTRKMSVADQVMEIEMLAKMREITVNRCAPVVHAARALLADIRARHPGQELQCGFIRALDDAVNRTRGHI